MDVLRAPLLDQLLDECACRSPQLCPLSLFQSWLEPLPQNRIRVPVPFSSLAQPRRRRTVQTRPATCARRSRSPRVGDLDRMDILGHHARRARTADGGDIENRAILDRIDLRRQLVLVAVFLQIAVKLKLCTNRGRPASMSYTAIFFAQPKWASTRLKVLRLRKRLSYSSFDVQSECEFLNRRRSSTADASGAS